MKSVSRSLCCAATISLRNLFEYHDRDLCEARQVLFVRFLLFMLPPLLCCYCIVACGDCRDLVDGEKVSKFGTFYFLIKLNPQLKPDHLLEIQ
jgi:hypothetical protein